MVTVCIWQETQENKRHGIKTKTRHRWVTTIDEMKMRESSQGGTKKNAFLKSIMSSTCKVEERTSDSVLNFVVRS
jgi:hypothetical protein